MSTITMADFQKKLLDSEHKINSNHDEVSKRLNEFQIKLGEQADEIKNLHDKTNRIEIKMENYHVETKASIREVLTMLKILCKRLNCTPKQLLKKGEENQEHISSYSTKSTDSHEKVESPKKSATPHQEASNIAFTNKQLWDNFTNQHPFFAQPLATYQRRAKFEMPKFDGNKKNNVAWINKAEEYFEIYDINDDDKKLRHASMKMEGEAYN